MKPSLHPCLVLAVTALFAAFDATAQATPDPAAAQTKAQAPKKAAAPKKAGKATKDTTPGKRAVSKNVTIYKNTPPPPIKGKDGKDIPTSPDAYDVSSAVPRKK